MSKSFSTAQQFIDKARNVHGNLYDYSDVSYVDSKTKVRINCKVHGQFLQSPASHLQGYGCRLCGREKTKAAHQTITPITFVSLAKQKHSNAYEYPDPYIAYKKKITIRCLSHGVFSQTPDAHLRGQGCPRCKYQTFSVQRSMSMSLFEERANSVHSGVYTYSNVQYKNAKTLVSITCSLHGDFLQRPADHIHKQAGCPTCKRENLSGRYTQAFFESNPSKKDTPCVVYLLRLIDGATSCMKIGITTQPLSKRLSLYPHTDVVVLDTINTTLYTGWQIEQQFLSSYERQPQERRFPGNTECLREDERIANKFNELKER